MVELFFKGSLNGEGKSVQHHDEIRHFVPQLLAFQQSEASKVVGYRT